MVGGGKGFSWKGSGEWVGAQLKCNCFVTQYSSWENSILTLYLHHTGSKKMMHPGGNIIGGWKTRQGKNKSQK